jgi:hypothetical protein
MLVAPVALAECGWLDGDVSGTEVNIFTRPIIFYTKLRLTINLAASFKKTLVFVFEKIH